MRVRGDGRHNGGTHFSSRTRSFCSEQFFDNDPRTQQKPTCNIHRYQERIACDFFPGIDQRDQKDSRVAVSNGRGEVALLQVIRHARSTRRRIEFGEQVQRDPSTKV